MRRRRGGAEGIENNRKEEEERRKEGGKEEEEYMKCKRERRMRSWIIPDCVVEGVTQTSRLFTKQL